jgi:hypothetical protein
MAKAKVEVKELTYKDVWDTLSKIDCSDHIEKKMNLSYLSWAWAWGILMQHYPDAKIGFYEQKETGIPYVQMPDGSAEVRCRVQIGSLIREMWLPVMDYKNNAVENPNSRQVSDTKMRCLVKCLALFGLGHYIYGGEDTPSDDTKEESVGKPSPAKKENIIDESDFVEEQDVDPETGEDFKSRDWAEAFFDGFKTTCNLYDTKSEVRQAMASSDDVSEDGVIQRGNGFKFGKIKTHHPELYKECMAELKEITQDLPDGAKSEKE